MQVRRLPPRLHDLRSTHPGTLPRPRISMTAQVPHAPAPPLAMACILEEATPTSLGLDSRRQLLTPDTSPPRDASTPDHPAGDVRPGGRHTLAAEALNTPRSVPTLQPASTNLPPPDRADSPQHSHIAPPSFPQQASARHHPPQHLCLLLLGRSQLPGTRPSCARHWHVLAPYA